MVNRELEKRHPGTNPTNTVEAHKERKKKRANKRK